MKKQKDPPMKILVTLFEIMDYGGIIQHTENLILGLKDLGHEVDFLILKWRAPSAVRRAEARTDAGWLPSAAGGSVHQVGGWRGVPVMGYAGAEGMKQWKQLAKSYDLILHEVPTPTLNKQNMGNTEWPELFNIRTPQIPIVHDGNMEFAYPFLSLVAGKCVGVACVHPAALESCRHLKIPRALIMSSHTAPMEGTREWSSRKKSFAAAHIWKRWKRMDDLIRAIPEIETKMEMTLAGDGIERRYMCSPDKCKEIYFDDKGRRIWEQAEKHGMKWLGVLSQPEVLKLYGQTRLMIDPSGSKKYAKLGSHFNRSMFDAVKCGAVPLARDTFIAEAHKIKLWIPGENCISFPDGSTPYQLACEIEEAVRMPRKQALNLVKGGMDLFYRVAERRVVAQMYIDLMKGRPTGAYRECPVGAPTKEFTAKTKKMFEQFKGE